jgi:hypothetical protein
MGYGTADTTTTDNAGSTAEEEAVDAQVRTLYSFINCLQCCMVCNVISGTMHQTTFQSRSNCVAGRSHLDKAIRVCHVSLYACSLILQLQQLCQAADIDIEEAKDRQLKHTSSSNTAYTEHAHIVPAATLAFTLESGALPTSCRCMSHAHDVYLMFVFAKVTVSLH